eukprot:TRINITY_DN33663_c0_g1_i1.p1 TRINITY_DN33663_c0_g1~~TRINITY_DN33663_c0_g1_i1.p1  ORF type:complete len:464 (-),score=102.77 TRINITY_DN33663_c0_g1_i1:121-1512(-)
MAMQLGVPYLQALGLDVVHGSGLDLVSGSEAPCACSCVSQTADVPRCPAPKSTDVFSLDFEVAYASALTKFDSLDRYFSSGMAVPEVAAMLEEELRADEDFLQALQALPDSRRDTELQARIGKAVGVANGSWKKGGGKAKTEGTAKKIKDVALPWASIDAYPEWVAAVLDTFLNASPEEHTNARRHLENKLLKMPLCSASVKYDGTCFGKMDNGELVGRKHVLGTLCENYMRTSTTAASTCDARALRRTLAELLGVTIGPLCIWGELMCNPNFYSYADRGLFSKWICFGVVAELDLGNQTSPDEMSAKITQVTERLHDNKLAYNVSPSGRLRLLLCPVLQRMLQDIAGCEVAEDAHPGLTHAEVVARGAAELRDGNNEGLVLAFFSCEGDHKASLRKWKNSAEGGSVALRHANLLRERLVRCQDLVEDGQLDGQVVDMLTTMIAVAEAQTNPSKKGRVKAQQS